MTAAIRPVAADELGAGQRQIANGIQRLVTNEFVLGVTQTLDIDHRIVVGNDNGIFQRRAERMPRSPETLDITHEAEGAGARQLGLEGLGGQIAFPLLPADQRAIEVDLDFETRTVIRAELAPGTTGFDLAPAS